MTEDNKTSPDEEKRDEKTNDMKLPHCMKAPSAEHQRGESEDAPCDDGRAGE